MRRNRVSALQLDVVMVLLSLAQAILVQRRVFSIREQ